MNILVISQYYYPEPVRVTDICESLVSRGHSVTVLCGLPNYPEGKILKEYRAKREELVNGVHVVRCNQVGRGKNAIRLILNYFSFPFFATLKAKKLKGDYDVVLINQLSPVMMAWPGLKYAKKHRKKTCLYCYDLWPASLAAGGIKKRSLVYKIFRKISKNIYDKTDHICVTSKSFIDYFREEHQVPDSKLTYIPQYCEDLFADVIPRTNDGTFNFVFAGNVGKMQSVETIIKAAELLQDDSRIRIHIVGEGRDLANCRKLTEEMGIKNIVFYGRRPIEEMPKFYSMADAMIVTLAKDELVSKTLPGKVQSYMAAGKPIIGAADGETGLIVDDAKCGICCESENPEKLAAAIKQMIGEDMTELGKNAESYYKRCFSKECFMDSLIAALGE